MSATPRVVVLGAGFAGLETAFYLRHTLHDKVDLTLVNDHDYFVFKPNTIYIPFGDDPEKFRIGLDGPTKRKNIEFIQGHVHAVDPAGSKVQLEDRELTYDYLVIATGAAMRPGEIPGLRENSVTIWTPDDMMALRFGYQRMLERAKFGDWQKLLFVIPPNNRCSAPLYEMAFMTDTWLRDQGIRDMILISWATYEDSYLQTYGPRLNTVVTEEFEHRGIYGHTGRPLSHIDPGKAFFHGGEEKDFDLMVAFPPYVASRTYVNLPCDDRGFLRVDPESRRVKGQDRIFAAGDASDFPVKQAFNALLQADSVADQIAAAIENRRPTLHFEPMSICVLDELNKATFAQVPLKYTRDAGGVAVDTEDLEHYKVGVSPMWRIGKKMLGLYLPWRFGHGEPFYSGLAWDAMDLGLKVMSKALAR